jgi:hypothetical protein
MELSGIDPNGHFKTETAASSTGAQLVSRLSLNVAAHDEFGPQSTEFTRAVTHVFRSKDRGLTWQPLSTIRGAFWSTLFVHRGALYLLGTDQHHGNAVLRRSIDGGLTWTSPTNGATGLLRDNGQYHCAPVLYGEV